MPVNPRLARTLARAATLLLLSVVVLPGSAPHAADPLPYVVTIEPTGNSGLDQAIAGSSILQSLRESAPVGPFALIARAQDDAGRFRTALDSLGFYKGTVRITIAGKPLDDPGLPDQLDAAPAEPPAKVSVHVETGPVFHLGTVKVEGAAPEAARAKLGLDAGAPAIAADVLAARARLLNAMRDDGYALAKVAEPIAVLRPDRDALDVTYKAESGPRVDLGPITISGLRTVNPGFVENRLLVHQGEQFSPAAIERARQDLTSIPVFASVRVVPAAELDAAGQLPLAFDITERKLHAVTVGASYSTDLGPNATATWSHRNLFGNAEQLNVTAGIQPGGGTAQREPGYNANVQFIKPDFLARDQQLQLDAGAIKQSLQAYDQTAALADILLNRKFSERWSGSVGLAGEKEQIKQVGITRDYTLLGVPVTVKYDSTDSLFEPTGGIRAAISATPTQSFGDRNATFVLLQASGSTYLDLATLDLTAPGRSIIAIRGLIGDAEGASQFELPPDKRFYAGGSATVRGYRYQGVGPQFAGTDIPQGGTSIAAATVEFRQRILDSYGVAMFIDAGQVAADGPPLSGTWRLGAGVGARYYTPIGPIRADIAVPLNPPRGSDTVEFYIGIGEAF